MKKIFFALFLSLLFITCKKDELTEPGVIICSQIWMAKNLDVSTYRNGDTIPEITDYTDWINTTTGAWCWYNNDTVNAAFGKLYNWYAVNDPRGLAPQGWHIANEQDWQVLQDYVYININRVNLNEDQNFKMIIGLFGLTNFSNITRDVNSDFTTSPPDIFLPVALHNWMNSSESKAIYVTEQRGDLPNFINWPKETGISVRCVKDK